MTFAIVYSVVWAALSVFVARQRLIHQRLAQTVERWQHQDEQ